MSARLLVISGAGGVGKTTVSAAIAVTLASQGERVALITIDPARRLADALNVSNISSSLSIVQLERFLDEACDGTLSAMMLDRSTSARRLVLSTADDLEAAHRVINTRFFKAFSADLAGAQEYLALFELYQTMSSEEFDWVVVDTPPARHLIDFLHLPSRLRKSLHSSSLNLLKNMIHKDRPTQGAKGLIFRALSTITATSFLKDLIHFIVLFYDALDQLNQNGEYIEQMLKSKQSALLLVCTPTPGCIEVISETEKILNLSGFSLSGLVYNRDHSQRIPEVKKLDEAMQHIQLSAPVTIRDTLKQLNMIARDQRSRADLLKAHIESKQSVALQEYPISMNPNELVQKLVKQLHPFVKHLRDNVSEVL